MLGEQIASVCDVHVFVVYQKKFACTERLSSCVTSQKALAKVLETAKVIQVNLAHPQYISIDHPDAFPYLTGLVVCQSGQRRDRLEKQQVRSTLLANSSFYFNFLFFLESADG